MGFMTEVSILNDRWDEIRKSPKEFVEQLYEHSMEGRKMALKWVIGQTTVAPTHHADDIRVYYAGRNSFFDAYPARYNAKRLKYHLDYLREMKNYIRISEKATKAYLKEAEENEAK
jgi:hypothetical protein